MDSLILQKLIKEDKGFFERYAFAILGTVILGSLLVLQSINTTETINAELSVISKHSRSTFVKLNMKKGYNPKLRFGIYVTIYSKSKANYKVEAILQDTINSDYVGEIFAKTNESYFSFLNNLQMEETDVIIKFQNNTLLQEILSSSTFK
jgi:nitrate/TMAO reductase-like tetraheme cytochrome c subunit